MKLAVALAVVLAAALPAAAQDAALRSLEFSVRVEGRSAKVVVDLTIANPHPTDQEVRFLFPIPRDAQVSSFALWEGGKKLEGKLLPADEARKIYQDIVRRRKDPALLEFVGRGAFQTGVFPVPPGEVRKLRAEYHQLLLAESGLVKLPLPFPAALESAGVRVEISGPDPIKNLYSPTHAVSVDRPSDRKAVVTWSRKPAPAGDLELYWSEDARDVGASLLTFRPEKDKPGYFLLLASPKLEPDPEGPEPKDVVFVLDRSGSMRIDGKMRQAREALARFLAGLNPGDRYSIVTFSSGVETFRDVLVEPTPATLDAARRFLDASEPVGGTSLADGLAAGLRICTADGSARLKLVVLLTDGVPTIGERDAAKILREAASANAGRARIFPFGIGLDVHAALLDRLATENGGLSEYVKPGEDLAVRIGAFHDRVRHPVLSGVRIAAEGVRLLDVQPQRIPDLFHGRQVVLSGRYEGSGAAALSISGRSRGAERVHRVEAWFDEATVGDSRAFVELVWATRQVGFLIERVQAEGASKELVDEIVRISTRYGILTEYTAFLAREDVDLAATAANNEVAYRNLGELKNESGARGVNQSENKKQCQEAQQPRANRWSNERGEETVVANCRNVGRRTFFQKRARWTEVGADEKAPAREVAYFSDEFFRLLEEKPELNGVAALGRDVLVKADGGMLRLRLP